MSKKKFGDIDIDVLDRLQILSHINFIPASIIKDNSIDPHNTGAYIQDIPKDPITGLASIDYKSAEELGYMKIDFINMGAYKGVKNEAHLIELLDRPINWDLFNTEEVVKKLYHIHDHYALVSKMNPRSIEQLAMVLALIRPGKRYLVGKSWEDIEKEIWIKTDEYAFKKSHSFGYSLSIAAQYQMLIETNAI